MSVQVEFNAISIMLMGDPRPVKVAAHETVSIEPLDMTGEDLPRLPVGIRSSLQEDLAVLKKIPSIRELLLVAVTNPKDNSRRGISYHLAHSDEAAKLAPKLQA